MFQDRFIQLGICKWKLLSCHNRQIHFPLVPTRRLCSSSKGGNAKKESKPPPLTLCQVNNHPSYRLKRAKARLEAISTAGKMKWVKPTLAKTYSTPRVEKAPTFVKYYNNVHEHGIAVVSNENPARLNDGTSSGAVAEERLRMARRRALESMARPSRDSTMEPTDRGGHANAPIPQGRCRPVREHDLDIVTYENPVRSNDGTSSGALAADRLRMARRKALESMSKPISTSTVDSKTEISPVREHGLEVVSDDIPIRSNDGTSSGAIAADRLREARIRALKSMSTPNSILASDSKSDQLVKELAFDIGSHENPDGSKDATTDSGGALQEDVSNLTPDSTMERLVSKRNKPVKEHGLNIAAYENPVRSNDGTSSGALAADRLRMARRRVLESMISKPIPDSKVDQLSVPVDSK